MVKARTYTARRTHSSIETLPRELKLSVDKMLIDGDWPEDEQGKQLSLANEGKPTYDNVVEYIAAKGFKIARSSVGRYAKPLVFFARYRESAAFAADVMSEAKSNAQGQTQKAVAEMATAMLIDMLASGGEQSPKDMAMICSAVKDCTQVAIKADQYKQQQFETRAKVVAAKVNKMDGLSDETKRIIVEDIYGLYEMDKDKEGTKDKA